METDYITSALLTCMRSLVNFEILAARKNFAAILERTRERLLARVNPNVIDELVFCLERFAVSRTLLPEAGVIGALGPANVIDRYVRHNLLHGGEFLQTGRALLELLLRLRRHQRLRINR